MNREEAKNILLLYRHHNPADEQDPLIIEALALARQDPELARWLEMNSARQFVLQEKFRRIPVPEGLKEQIISEHAATQRAAVRRRQLALTAALTIVILFALGVAWLKPRRPAEDTLAVFQNRMAGLALRGYAMDTNTSDAEAIRTYLKLRQSPADYVLPAPLKPVAQSGCAVEGWLDQKVSLICFRTGQPLPPGSKSDLWLFVVDQKSVQGAPIDSTPQITKVNELVTATWVRDGKLYFLGLEGGPADIQKFL